MDTMVGASSALVVHPSEVEQLAILVVEDEHESSLGRSRAPLRRLCSITAPEW